MNKLLGVVCALLLSTGAFAANPQVVTRSNLGVITVADNVFLNYTAPTVRGYGYTVFGKVVKGMDVVERIAHLATGAGGPFPQDVPQQQVVIEDVKLVAAK